MYIQKIISRNDGLLHLLYSDVQRLLMSVANDFPEIAKVKSIGQSNEGRDILVLELSMDKKDEKPVKPSHTAPSSEVLLQFPSMSWVDTPNPDENKPGQPGSLGHQVLA